MAMTMARAVVIRPNMAMVLCISARGSSRRALTYQGCRQLLLLSPVELQATPLAAASAAAGHLRRAFCIRATSDLNSMGPIDSPLMQSMENKIKEHLNAESVRVKDAYVYGRHVSIDVVSAAFEGQSAVNRQRLVYKAIWEELQNTVHAVDQMTTKTPTEAAEAAQKQQ